MATTQRVYAPRPRRGGPDVVALTVHACGTGALIAVLGVAISLIVAVCTWAVAPHDPASSPEAAVRLAAGMWLLAHHVALDLRSGSLGLTPIGLMIVPALLLYGGGRHLARVLVPRSLPDVVRAVIPYALTYGVVAAIAAGILGSSAVRPHALAAFVAGALFALVFGALGMLRAAELLGLTWRSTPNVVRQTLAGAVVGLATLLALGALATSLALAMGFPESVDMFRALDPDPVGGIMLALLGVALVPNLVVWAVAFSTGIGFSLGAGSAVSPRGIAYGPLPVFPPLGSVPPEGHPGAIAMLVLVAPLAAGVGAGLLVHRRLRAHPAERVALVAAGAGLLTGAGLALACWLSSGSVADGQLSQVGPVAWQVGLVGGLEVGLVAAATAWEAHRRSWDGQRIITLRNGVGRVLTRGARSGGRTGVGFRN